MVHDLYRQCFIAVLDYQGYTNGFCLINIIVFCLPTCMNNHEHKLMIYLKTAMNQLANHHLPSENNQRGGGISHFQTHPIGERQTWRKEPLKYPTLGSPKKCLTHPISVCWYHVQSCTSPPTKISQNHPKISNKSSKVHPQPEHWPPQVLWIQWAATSAAADRFTVLPASFRARARAAWLPALLWLGAKKNCTSLHKSTANESPDPTAWTTTRYNEGPYLFTGI